MTQQPWTNINRKKFKDGIYISAWMIEWILRSFADMLRLLIVLS